MHSAEQLQGAAFRQELFPFEPQSRPVNHLYVLNFGQHAGKSISELHAEDTEWLVFHTHYHSHPCLYEALEEDGCFQPKQQVPSAENVVSVVVEAPVTLGFALVDEHHSRKRMRRAWVVLFKRVHVSRSRLITSMSSELLSVCLSTKAGNPLSLDHHVRAWLQVLPEPSAGVTPCLSFGSRHPRPSFGSPNPQPISSA